MYQLEIPVAELGEAVSLLQSKHIVPAVQAYEGILRAHPASMHRQMLDVENVFVHKAFLKARLYLQMAAQTELEHGFTVNFGDYCFLNQPRPDIHIGAKAIEAVEQFKGGAPSMHRMRLKAPDKIAQSPHAVAMIYYAHTVSADILDLLLLSRGRATARVAEFGAGVGLQAVTLAAMNTKIEALHLFENDGDKLASIAALFESNRLKNYTLNEPLGRDIDCFYSFRACGYVFSVDEYFDDIGGARSRASWALADIGHLQDRLYQLARLKLLFDKSEQFYAFGGLPNDYMRTLFERSHRRRNQYHQRLSAPGRQCPPAGHGRRGALDETHVAEAGRHAGKTRRAHQNLAGLRAVLFLGLLHHAAAHLHADGRLPALRPRPVRYGLQSRRPQKRPGPQGPPQLAPQSGDIGAGDLLHRDRHLILGAQQIAPPHHRRTGPKAHAHLKGMAHENQADGIGGGHLLADHARHLGGVVLAGAARGNDLSGGGGQSQALAYIARRLGEVGQGTIGFSDAWHGIIPILEVF